MVLVEETVLPEEREIANAIGGTEVLHLKLVVVLLDGLANAGPAYVGQRNRNREVVGHAIGIGDRVGLDGAQIVHVVAFGRAWRHRCRRAQQCLSAQAAERLVIEGDRSDAVILIKRIG